MSRATAQVSPFAREGLLRRTAPFLAAMLLSYAAIRLPATERDESEILIAAGLNVLLIVAVVVLPWERFPRTADLLPPLAYMIVITLLRDALGGAGSAYSTLLILPVLWLAMYGTRAQLAVGVLGVGVLLAMPALLIGSPEYPDEEWRRTLLWVTVAGIIGLAVQDLVAQVRRRAEALHTVSEAVGRRTQETETRSAICEAAKQNARAAFAFLLEPDANDRRLVTTAATDKRIEGTDVLLNDHVSHAVHSYRSGREDFEHDVARTPLNFDNDTPLALASILWHPVPGRESAMGVLAVAWTERIKRLPDTLPAVMDALAAEAAGVIERTTLLLKLESVVKVDAATELPNERAWEEEVPREMSRARRSGEPLSVAILDLGDFELAPDGELDGRDRRLLRETAKAWSQQLRPGDYLAHRDPPGLFGVLLPGMGPDDAESASLRLQALVRDRECMVSTATWDGFELPAALVGRAEVEIELDRAALRRD